MTNEFDVLNPEREKPLNPWQPERDPIRLAILGKLLEELAEAQAIVARCIIQGIDESEPVTGVHNLRPVGSAGRQLVFLSVAQPLGTA